MTDNFFEQFDDSISLMTVNPKIIFLLKQKSFPNVKKISVPAIFLSDITILKSFPNLECIEINTDFSLNRTQIDYIKGNTKVNKIVGKKKINYDYEMSLLEEEIHISSPVCALKTGNLTIYELDGYRPSNKLTVQVNSDKYDLDKIREFCCEFNLENISKFTIESFKEEYFLHEKFLEIKFNQSDNSVSIYFNGINDISGLIPLYDRIRKKYSVNKVTLKCDNKTYDKLYYLNKIDRETYLNIEYEDFTSCNLESFKAMRATIDWFNSLIRENDLSPLEIIILSYDIMKTFKYKENRRDYDQARKLHNIVMSDYIVCSGYSDFLNEILRENNIRITDVSVFCKKSLKDEYPKYPNHSRNIVRIDDDKYDIHGLFSLDATWDNNYINLYLIETENGEKKVAPIVLDGSKIIKQYNSTGLYNNFLVPANDYEKVYPYNTKPNLFQIILSGDYNEMFPFKAEKEYDYLALTQAQNLFGKDFSVDELINYGNTCKPSLEVFSEALYNVRLAEGYSCKEASQSVKECIELHEAIDTYNKKIKCFFASNKSNKIRN